MHDHSMMSPLPVALYGAPGHEDQRALLLELVVLPPEGGEDVGSLARRLELAPGAGGQALRTLVDAGLAVRSGGRVWPSVAARSFEELLPARL